MATQNKRETDDATQDTMELTGALLSALSSDVEIAPCSKPA